MVDDVGYNLYVFEIRIQQTFTAFQPFKVEFKFDGIVSNVINGYDLVLKNKLVGIGSVGQCDFDLVGVIFNFFNLSLFSFNVNFVLFKTASLYRSSKLSMR